MKIYNFLFIFFHWKNWKNEFIGKFYLEKPSRKTPKSVWEIQSAFQGDQPPIGRSRKLGSQREFHVSALQRNWDSTCLRPKRTEIPRACVQKDLRFHVPVPKRNGDSTSLRPKWTEILLASSQKELRFHLPTSKKNFYSTCPPPKSTGTPTTHVRKRKKSSQLFGLLLVFCSFAAPEKKKGFLFPLKN
jgi:hypothetical protein